ncbi:MAG: hypothetical protein AAGC85_02430 [Bacteroidota bacterium]
MRPDIDIYKALRVNRMITLSSVGLALLAIGGSLFFAYQTYIFNLNHAFTLDRDGEVLPLQWVERNRVIEVEIKDHLKKWFETYYSYDANNLEAQRELGLWLVAGEDGKNLEQYYTETSWYEDVKRFNIIQKTSLDPASIVIQGKDEPFMFQANALIEVRRGNSTTHYELVCAGFIYFVSPNFPLNPHGLLISNYQWELQNAQVNKSESIKNQPDESR